MPWFTVQYSWTAVRTILHVNDDGGGGPTLGSAARAKLDGTTSDLLIFLNACLLDDDQERKHVRYENKTFTIINNINLSHLLFKLPQNSSCNSQVLKIITPPLINAS